MDKLHSIAGILVTVIILGLFGAAIVLVILHGIPDSRPLDILLGALAAQMVTVVQFWMGSSAGSARKTELLNK